MGMNPADFFASVPEPSESLDEVFEADLVAQRKRMEEKWGAHEQDVIEQNEGPRDEPHTCSAAYDQATSPDPGGSIEVTEFCECGRAIRTYLDTVM